ncbi:MAG: FliM/FliN family flagellar motor switch protein [Candidatus Gastranaerophilales bacterium]|nr:FliM/FliN family flagellar motor switch protein [Candidatus Gastranaerophilales bacterium]
MTTQTTKSLDTSIKQFLPFFQWFEAEFSNLISQKCSEFWLYTPKIKLFSLERNTKNFLKGTPYFVTQAQFQNIKCVIRLSDGACERFLTKSLGKNGRSFEFTRISELEAQILSRFNNNVFDGVKNYFVSKEAIKKLTNQNEMFDDILNFGLILYDDDNFEAGKMIFTLPVKLIKYPELAKLDEERVNVDSFTRALAEVDIAVGKTKLSLDDVKHIETDDIVVLEKSNIKKMSIINPAHIDFKVNPDPRLFMREDDEHDELIRESEDMTAKNIWDNIQVDVTAKFNQVKMSLGELRQMSEGLVMELDSIYENDILLEVEDKNVAKGELVIIGDKYGVKITEIFAQPRDVEKTVKDDTEEQPNELASDDDDFDVNDFDIDEEEI